MSAPHFSSQLGSRPSCSLGCPKNTVDGEVLLGDLFRSGFEITDAHEQARRGAWAHTERLLTCL